jgi:hypothetical protein
MTVERIDMMIELNNTVWVKILWARVIVKTILQLTICQKRDETGRTKRNAGRTSLSVPHGRDRNKGTNGGILFHFHMMTIKEMRIHKKTIRLARGNIQF